MTKKPTAYEIAMIAATLNRATAQGISDAMELYKLAAREIAKPEPDTRRRTIPQALGEIGLKSTDALINLLEWKFEKHDEKGIADRVYSDFKKNGISLDYIENLKGLKKRKRSKTAKESRPGKKPKKPIARK